MCEIAEPGWTRTGVADVILDHGRQDERLSFPGVTSDGTLAEAPCLCVCMTFIVSRNECGVVCVPN